MTSRNSDNNRPINGETAAWYKEFVDQAHDMIQCVDSEGRFIYINQAWLKTLKYSAEEVADLTLWEIIHPDSLEHCKAVFEQILAGKAAGKVEATFETKDGSPVLIEGNVGIKLDEMGRLVHTRGFFRDITAIKKIEQDLRESEQKLKTVTENMTDIVLIIDPEGRYTHVSGSSFQHLGYTPEELLGMSSIEMCHEEDRERVIPALHDLLSSKQSEVRVELRVKSKSGKYIWFESSGRPLYDNANQVTGILAVSREIGERKQAEAKLAESERKLHSYKKNLDLILENVSDNVWSYDLDAGGNFVSSYISPAGAKLLGIPESELNHSFDVWFSHVVPEDLPSVQAAMADAINSGQGKPVEYRIRRPDGSIKWVRSIGNPIKRKDGGIRLVGNGQDITDRKHLEQALFQSEERFQKMLSLVPDLVSIHDADMNIVYSNWNGFGAVPAEKRILNTKCYKTYRGLDQICPDCQAVTVLKTGETFQKEVELPGEMWVELRVIPIPGEGRKVEFFVEWVRDITDRKQSEKELISQHKLLEGIMDNVADVLSIQYPDHTIERYNRAGYELLGMTPEEVRGKKCHQLIGRTRECENCATSRALQSGKMEQVERYFPELGIHLDCRTNPVFEDGKIVLLIQHLRNITERKEAEEALQKQRNLLKDMYDSIQDGISILNPDLTIREVNQTMEKWYDHAAPFLGKKCYEVYQNRAEPCVPCPSINALNKKTACFEVVPLVKKAKQVGWLELYAYPILDKATGKVSGIVEFVRNITERKEAEEELLKFKTAVEQSADGVAMSDMSGNIIFINRAWAEMHGYTTEEVKGRHLSIFHNEEQVDNHVKPFIERLKANGSNQGEVGHTRKDGTSFPTQITSTIIRKSEGKPFGMLAIAHDITERKNSEEELKRQAAERAAVDTFTYSVSNDLQAPLRRIEGFSEALLEECPGELSEQARDYLTRIITQVGSMKDITDALLQLSRVVSSKVERETVNLSALTRSCLEKLRHENPERRVEAVIAPELVAEGDADLLNKMLANLVDNAWKFTSGVETAKIEFGSIVKSGRKVYYLKDNGIGFNMNHADKLFVPFHKLHHEEKYPGIGIGLNLAYRIISRLGGEIWAEGEEGKGACFYFTLP